MRNARIIQLGDERVKFASLKVYYCQDKLRYRDENILSILDQTLQVCSFCINKSGQ